MQGHQEAPLNPYNTQSHLPEPLSLAQHQVQGASVDKDPGSPSRPPWTYSSSGQVSIHILFS